MATGQLFRTIALDDVPPFCAPWTPDYGLAMQRPPNEFIGQRYKARTFNTQM